ncbi:MAG: hypothetical protein KF746_11775 [Chitinophagaceae bacterium]|nr:hypothetical protein [Chitinophagaceae bacterium]
MLTHAPISCTLTLLICITCNVGRAQEVRGTVYDITQKYVLPSVSVLSTSGYGTATDSLGTYRIRVQTGDSIWFSYLGKATPKYAVATIQNPAAFDISIMIAAVELPGISIRKPGYRFDSLQNRKEYAKAFNYRAPGLRITSLSPGSSSLGPGVGLDINELINVFRFRRNRNMEFIQGWLIKEEQDKYIDYRFNKAFIRKLTFLYDEEEMEVFMKYYRPEYDWIVSLNDAELGMYILECFEDFKKRNRLRDERQRLLKRSPAE